MTTIRKYLRSLVFVALLAVSSVVLSGCTAAQGFQIVAAVLGGIANIFENVAGIVGGGAAEPPAEPAVAPDPGPAPAQPAAPKTKPAVMNPDSEKPVG